MKQTASPSPQPNTRYATLFFWLGLAVTLAYAAWYNWAFADMVNLSVDETTHLMWLRLIQAGYKPYSEIYITYPPVFPLFLELSWVLWPSLAGLCWASFGYALLTAVAVALLTRRLSTALAGLFAAFVIANSFGSCSILSEKMSMSGAIFAVWLAMVYRDTGRRWLLPLSALTLTISQLTKIQSPFIPGVIAFILAQAAWQPANGVGATWRSFRWRQFVVDGLIWGGALIAAIAVFYLRYDLHALYDQTLGQHLAAREAFMDDATYWASSLSRLIEFVQDNLWLLPLALVGFIQMFIHKTKDRYTLLLWFTLAAITLLVHRPLRNKHFIVFEPLLAIWAGLAVSYGWLALKQLRTTSWPIRGLAAVTAVLLLGYLLPTLTTVAGGWRGESPLLAGGPPPNKEQELNFIDAVTLPSDCLLTDNMRLAYFSGRQVPPELAEISSNRFRSGHLTLADLVVAGTEHDCQIVATDSRIARFTPDFKKWAEINYLGRFRYDENAMLYVSKIKTTPNPEYPQDSQLGEAIRFLGYSVQPDHPAAGQRLTLISFWKAIAPVDTDYTIFVQLRDANNNTILGADHQPYEGIVPTGSWRVDAVVRDVVHLDLPPDLPPGDYKLAVGMYRLDTLERLPLLDDAGGENALLLGPISISQ
ncbi:MAG: hypothetical protein H6632_15490 [Anaerolineales bacterium]|nr:hypothetical protein [Anaerolineales bacterium]